MKNPLLTTEKLPAFDQIKPEHIEPALDQILTENRTRIAALLADEQPHTWNNLIYPLEILENRLHRMWSPVSHLHAVKQTDELREKYHVCLPKLTAYSTELSQNKMLYSAVVSITTSPAYAQLEMAQQQTLQNQLHNFKLAGVALADDTKKRFADIQMQLAELQNKFEEYVLDATRSWNKHITSKDALNGIPAHTLATAHAAAKQKNLEGWLLTLDFPCYFSVISYADNRALREEMYSAYTTRASDQGPDGDKFNNANTMVEILKLRQEESQLLGFHNYAELSLARKMVKDPNQVLDFLYQLIEKVRPKAQRELQELTVFANQLGHQGSLQPWDISYYSEKLRKKLYGIDDETLRLYFPIEKVLSGMFEVVHRLYGMNIKEMTGISTWHPDVRFFEIRDKNNQLRGEFYLDLYAREKKREGAWMDHYNDRFRFDDGLQTPVAYLTCNLTPPSSGKPGLLNHEEIVTLFHEFGHGLHQMLTQIDYPGVSGINGVAWDAVELPSQFMEFFTFEKPVLEFISEHYQTKKPLPENLLQELIKAKNFHTGLYLLRQLEFALFDFRLHMEFKPSSNYQFIQNLMTEIRHKFGVITVPAYNRFQNTFSHIFAGGYSAGYYSYLWAEMLASDAYAKFEENGIFDKATGQAFLTHILEKGGSEEILDLFIKFRGRAPTIDALLRHKGI